MSQFEGNQLYSKDTTELLGVIGGHDAIQTKVRAVEIILDKLMLNGWEQMTLDILDVLLKLTKELIENVLEENTELLEGNNDVLYENVATKLGEHLELAVKLVKCVNILLAFVMSRGATALSQILSVPLTILNIVQTTFTHCKLSKTLYHVYFESIQEIIQLFRSAQEIHQKFLKIVPTHLTINIESQNEKLVILNVIDGLCDVIKVTLGINTKTVVDTWKGVLALIKPYAAALQYELNIDKVLKILSMECLRTMNDIDKTLTDENQIKQFLKINKFYMKVAEHIFVDYWELSKQLQAEVLDFFTRLHSFPDPYVYPRTVTDEILVIFSDIYYTVTEEFLSKFISEVDTLEIADVISTDDENCLGVFILLLKILDYIDLYPGINRIYGILKAVFKRLETGTQMFQMNLRINERPIYEHLQQTFGKRCLEMGAEEYELVECLLLENTLKGNTLQSQFAIDLWTLLLRHSPPALNFGVITPILDLILSEPQLQYLSDNSLQYQKLMCFAQTVCNNLPKESKEDILDLYLSDENITIFRFIGFEKIPKRNLSQIDSAVKKIYKSIDRMDKGNMDMDDWLFVINGLAVLAMLPDNLEISNKNHVEHVMKLWNVDFPEDGSLNDTLFSSFLLVLCRLTDVVILDLDQNQLVHIIKQLRSLLRNGSQHMKICGTHILQSIFESEIIADENLQETVSDILRCFLDDNSPPLKEFGFELVNGLLNTTRSKSRSLINTV